MGDTPYSEFEALRLNSLVNGLNEEKLAFVAHVGDITSGRGPCSDAWFSERKAQLARLKHPLFLLPGDNDWMDCHRSGFEPLERLKHWRSLFCVSNDKTPLNVERQKGEFCEHVRWRFEGVLFVALNVQGGNNNLGRTRAMDAEYQARMRQVLAWLEDSQKVFEREGLQGMVVLMQANPFLKPRSGRNGYAALLEKLQQLALAHPRSITLVNGDTHTFRDDFPLPGLHRIEVYGSPFVSWLRATSDAGALSVEVGGQY